MTQEARDQSPALAAALGSETEELTNMIAREGRDAVLDHMASAAMTIQEAYWSGSPKKTVDQGAPIVRQLSSRAPRFVKLNVNKDMRSYMNPSKSKLQQHVALCKCQCRL